VSYALAPVAFRCSRRATAGGSLPLCARGVQGNHDHFGDEVGRHGTMMLRAKINLKRDGTKAQVAERAATRRFRGALRRGPGGADPG
jgi:hypothetical protein